MINEDLVLTLESTSGRMRIYPMDGLWTIEAVSTEETGQAHIVVTGIELFSDAVRMVLGSLYNAVSILDQEQTLKDRVMVGLAGGLEEYREKALEKAVHI